MALDVSQLGLRSFYVSVDIGLGDESVDTGENVLVLGHKAKSASCDISLHLIEQHRGGNSLAEFANTHDGCF